jgi:ferredoxin-NADP reductase
MEGPFGSSFCLERYPYQKYIFICGGVGIAPFMSIMRSRSSAQNAPEMNLWYFNSKSERRVYGDEVHLACQLHHIFVSDVIGPATLSRENVDLSLQTAYCICGPQPMVNAVYTQLARFGVQDKQMIFEEVYPSSHIEAKV